jgi:hypothetical protein
MMAPHVQLNDSKIESSSVIPAPGHGTIFRRLNKANRPCNSIPFGHPTPGLHWTRIKDINSLLNSLEFLLPLSFTGDASAAIACNEWNVDPMRNQSLVESFGGATALLEFNIR